MARMCGCSGQCHDLPYCPRMPPEQRDYERHEFDPFHPHWHMPRCKVCRGFEDHRLHQPTEETP